MSLAHVFILLYSFTFLFYILTLYSIRERIGVIIDFTILIFLICLIFIFHCILKLYRLS